MRTVLGAILFGLAGAAILIGVEVLLTVWDDHADSPDSTYIEGAALCFGAAVVLMIGGALALRDRGASDRSKGRDLSHGA
jgi:hypothetical protein